MRKENSFCLLMQMTFLLKICMIIFLHALIQMQMLFFKGESGFSDNIDTRKVRYAFIHRVIDQYLSDDDEWPLRFKFRPPWGKMIKRHLINKYKIRFEEICYANDVLFSTYVGCFAKKIEAIDSVLYVVTSREGSMTYDYCKKTDELKIRAGAFFRSDAFLFQKGLCRERRVRFLLLNMFKQDRGLLKYYLFKLDEIYPSKLSALRDICRVRSIRFKIKFYLYLLLVWIKVL